MSEGVFDVIVVGAGHAGCEAAYAAARLGCRVGLCTMSRGTVAAMSCNPAIGGTAKGHLVREIDALGGLMGVAADATGIQFRLLNRSRGPAVWSPRAQADKQAYGTWMRRVLDQEANICWVEGEAAEILVERGRVAGVELASGGRLEAPAVIVTSGDVSERSDSHRRRADSGRPLWGAAVEEAGRIAEAARVQVGAPEDGHAAASGSEEPRPRGRGAGGADGAAGRRRGSRAVLVPDTGHRAAADAVLPGVHERARARAGPAEHRPLAAVQRSHLRDRAAVLPVARGQGDAVSRARRATRCSSNRRGSTSTRST